MSPTHLQINLYLKILFIDQAYFRLVGKFDIIRVLSRFEEAALSG